MISLIIGKKGAGKTKKMVDLVNETTSASKGNVVCIEKEPNLTFNVTNKARLLDTDYYGVSGVDKLYGFICGICAGNYDVTDIFIDATFRIVGRNYDQVAELLAKLFRQVPFCSLFSHRVFLWLGQHYPFYVIHQTQLNRQSLYQANQ